MRLRHMTFVALAVSVLFAACGGDDGEGTGGTYSEVASQPEITGVYGKVTDLNGSPLSGATLRAGAATVTTGADGRFELALAAAGDVMVHCEFTGYLPGMQAVDVQTGKGTTANFTLKTMAAAVALDVAVGGAVSGSNNAGITAPVDAFVNGAGAAVSGTVDVHLTPLDPSKPMELLAYPGDLVAEQEDGEQVVLESYGVLEVTVTQGGEELQIADGKTVAVRIPAPEGATNPPATMPMWYFDEDEGIWKEEGTVTYNATDHVYEGEVAHLSYWNADIGTPAACLEGRVLDGSGNPVVGARVVAGGVNYSGGTSATTGADGRFCIAVMPDSEIRLTISDGNGHVAQIQATSGPSGVALPIDCDTAECTDVGDIDMSVSGGDCADFLNLFQGTCVEEMMTLTECMDMGGGCRVVMNDSGTSMTIYYESGARIETETTGAASQDVFSADSTYYGSNGQECGTARTEGDLSGDEDLTTSITTSNGTWQITYHEADGSVTYVCPDGDEVHVTAAQMDAMNACMGGDTETCEVEGGITGGNCETDADCSDGFVCTDLGGAKYCQPDAGSLGCTSDDDCEEGMACNDVGSGYMMCTPDMCETDADCGEGAYCCDLGYMTACSATPCP